MAVVGWAVVGLGAAAGWVVEDLEEVAGSAAAGLAAAAMAAVAEAAEAAGLGAMAVGLAVVY